jgi:catechol 2,3-dioxygenase-like lactoylglutathione lyase family enzyme
MPLKIESIDHIQITVPEAALAEAINFYGGILGLEPIEKPEALRKNGGAWFRQESFELHLSVEDGSSAGRQSKRHVCFVVNDLREAESELVGHGVTIIPDAQRIPGWIRFYIRDPGGNRIEIAQRTPRLHGEPAAD